MSFSNPVPVAVALVPYLGKLVGIKRGIEPRKGGIAFPGGFINSGETFNQALSRELKEETGIEVAEDNWNVFQIGDSLQSNRILIFGICSEVKKIDLNYITDETEEVLLIDEKTLLTFPLHDDVKNKYFQSLK